MRRRWLLRASLALTISLWLVKLFTTELLYYRGGAPGPRSISGVAFRPIPGLGNWRPTDDGREARYLVRRRGFSYPGQDSYHWLVSAGYVHATAVSLLLAALSARRTKLLLAAGIPVALALWTVKALKSDLFRSHPKHDVDVGDVGRPATPARTSTPARTRRRLHGHLRARTDTRTAARTSPSPHGHGDRGARTAGRSHGHAGRRHGHAARSAWGEARRQGVRATSSRPFFVGARFGTA